ncbi:anti-sigma factor [Curvibacter sp. HBC28]|uniref:Anti-sigma factor n=1 Tax=Curvibacter microcysteis TaxID=3026419 RepID=A0ABT5MGK5_9BURK|nr:anti-sigma factor [Curvibacter sp. HBC28]MDD0815134.1 anti-sigma factor [Curvibacter sp. HBC28]
MTTEVPESEPSRDVLAGEYVLGTLSAAQRDQLTRQRQSDPLLDAAVTEWEEALLPLTDLVEPLAPAPRLWVRIERSLNLVQAQLPWWLRLWGNVAWWRGLSLAAVTATVAMAVVLITQSPAPEARFMVVLVAPQDKAPGWVVQVSDDRRVNLIPLGSFEVPPDKALQFWTKADGWQGPVSLGLIQPGKKTQIDLNRLPQLQSNQLFELTLEPATGSPTNKPTGPIQFIGRAVPVI